MDRQPYQARTGNGSPGKVPLGCEASYTGTAVARQNLTLVILAPR